MNVAIFGGTFDPIHMGHLRVARVASRTFKLDKVLFIPAGNPPHKRAELLTPFLHRYAMVTLACQEDPRFVPSLLEAPRGDGRLHFTIDTARRVKRSLQRRDRLYFIAGLDAFLDLPRWKSSRRLLQMMDFIVVSRPGFGADEMITVVPKDLLAGTPQEVRQNCIELRSSTIRVLTGVRMPVASRALREVIAARRGITGLVPRLVEEYIAKEGLYRTSARGRRLNPLPPPC